MLENPPAEFAEVVRDHFRLRAAHVRETVRAWVAEAHSDKGTPQHAARLDVLVEEFEAAFAKHGL